MEKQNLQKFLSSSSQESGAFGERPLIIPSTTRSMPSRLLSKCPWTLWLKVAQFFEVMLSHILKITNVTHFFVNLYSNRFHTFLCVDKHKVWYKEINILCESLNVSSLMYEFCTIFQNVYMCCDCYFLNAIFLHICDCV